MASKEIQPTRGDMTFEDRVDILNSLVDSDPEAGIPLEMPMSEELPISPQIEK